jgi:hypothetical protein
LSHPFIKDAAESSFVPVCVYNNTKDDDDARVRDSFKEPSWNNPVMRFLDGEKKDIVPRIHDRWTVEAVSCGMVETLRKAKKEIPPYLALLAEEEASRRSGVETAVFGMG